MAAVDPARVKTLKIKTGIVKRLAKEQLSYEQEANQQQAKVYQMKEEGKDEYDIRKMEEVVAESKMMIPDCERKLTVAWDDLTKLMESEKDLEECEEYKSAAAILQETKVQAKR